MVIGPFSGASIVLFGAAELCVASFGICSLRIFHWAALHTAGTSLPLTILFSLLLLIVPTMLMGATLPLLVEHLVRYSGQVGYSVATLYFVNTFGSAVACYLCATFLLRDFGQSGSVAIAAGANTIVGASALLIARGSKSKTKLQRSLLLSATSTNAPGLSLGMAMVIAGIAGFVALGFEIAWFRVFVMASTDRAPAFALMLSTYLAGIAAGSYIAGKLTREKPWDEIARIICMLMLLAGALSAYYLP